MSEANRRVDSAKPNPKGAQASASAKFAKFLRRSRDHESCCGGKSLTRLSLTRRRRFDALHHRRVVVSLNLRLCRLNRHETPPTAATLKRRISAATRKSCAVKQIRNGATVRENDATLRGIYAQGCENDAELRGINAQRRTNDAGRRETRKPTIGELFNAAK